MSDNAVGAEAKSALRNAATRLEDVKDIQKDWHPGSDGKVLDLVHPSLFPLLYGRSRILPMGNNVPLHECALHSGEGTIVPQLDVEDSNYSEKFQWLPCEMSLDEEGQATITSYINNLYPRGNEELYAAVEAVATASVPLWKESLISTLFRAPLRIDDDFGDGWLTKDEWYGKYGSAGDLSHNAGGNDDSRSGNEDSEDEDDWEARENACYYGIAVPTPKSYIPRTRCDKKSFAETTQNPYDNVEQARSSLENTFAKQGLQVIVKLANIHLTPDKPTYDGGSWHVEGQLNEHIGKS